MSKVKLNVPVRRRVLKPITGDSKTKIFLTRAKLVAKQRVGLPLMSEVKLEVPVRSRALKLITR